MTGIARLRDFVTRAQQIVERETDEPAILAELTPELAALVAHDDWLPDSYARSDGRAYCQHLLYGDPLDRLSIVSFVWGPGQRTPVHNHRVWGLVGVLRGAELSTGYTQGPDGALVAAAPERLDAGRVVTVSPSIGDIHTIANAFDDRASISIHVYGGNIGRIRRETFDPATGAAKLFVSGYSNADIPNLWAAE